MKRLWFCLLVLALLLSACGKSAPPPEEGAEGTSPPSEPVPAAYDLPVKFLSAGVAYEVSFDGEDAMVLTAETGARITLACSPDGSVRSAYEYDAYARETGRYVCETESDEAGGLLKITETRERETQVREYANGLLRRRITAPRDGKTRTEEFSYDADGRLLRRWTGAGGVLETERTYEYDAEGNLTKSVCRYADGSGERTALYEYENGLPVQEIRADGTRHAYAYDGHGRMLRHTVYRSPAPDDGAERPTEQTEWTYNERGDILTKTVYRVNGESELVPETVYTHAYEYDAEGRVLRHTIDMDYSVAFDPAELTAQYEEIYTYENGRVTTNYQYADGVTRVTVYDEAGEKRRWKDVFLGPYDPYTAYDVLETAPFTLTEAQYAFFLGCILDPRACFTEQEAETDETA